MVRILAVVGLVGGAPAGRGFLFRIVIRAAAACPTAGISIAALVFVVVALTGHQRTGFTI